MNVKLYNLSINPIIVDKTLGTPVSKTAVIKDILDVLNPVFELDYDSSILSCNYMYVQDLGRYYFINNIEIINHVITITGHVDVLKTYSAQIKAGKCTATRSNYKNKNIPESLALNIPQQKIQYRKLSQALSGETYICIIGG